MRIRVKVIPNAKRVSVEKKNDILIVRVDAPPVKGKANKRLVEILSEYLGVKKSRIRIVAGEHSREKIVEIIE